MVWIYTLISVIIISLISLVGVLTLSFSREKLDKFIIYLVSFAAGTLLGDAFIHLIPESFENGAARASLYVLVGIVAFFILEKLVKWRHCHNMVCDEHTRVFSKMILIGDIFHNFIDGVIIAASYLVSIPIGVATTVAVLFHEIPQEIGDFSSLLYGGFSKSKAIFWNFLTSLSAILGAIIILVASRNIEGLTNFLIPFTAGGFIYIASTDIMPELHKSTKINQSMLQLIFLLLGIGIMFALLFLG